MPLWDKLASFAAEYGPGILDAAQSAMKGSSAGSPMYPGGPSLLAPMRTGSRGLTMPGRRRKGRGLTASDIRGAQKVARLVQHFGFRPKIKARRRRR